MSKVLENLLAKHGYNLVALPQTGIEPRQLLFKNNTSLGAVNSSIETLFTSQNSPIPTIKPNQDISDINLDASIIFDSTAGISMLDHLLSKLKMGKLAANFKLNDNDRVIIQYKNITQRVISLYDLDNFISSSSPNFELFKANTFKKKLYNSELYVISSVLESNSFSITVTDKNGQHIDIEASIKDVIEPKLDVTHNQDNTIIFKHEASTPLVFAFKAQKIIYDYAKWWEIFNSQEPQFRIKDQQGVVLMGEEDFPTQNLNMTDDLIEF